MTAPAKLALSVRPAVAIGTEKCCAIPTRIVP